MQFYDLFHGYQPFKDPVMHFPWVEKNLREVFVPTARAIAAANIIGGFQIQGWTLNQWSNSNDEVQNMFNEMKDDLNKALSDGHVEVGFSGYSHPILPLLSEKLVSLQIQLDHEVVSSIFRAPTWFWPPEGAINKEVLKVIFEHYPNIIVMIPDMCIGRENYSGLAKIKHSEDQQQRVLVCNNILKDLFMNTMFYQENPHPEVLQMSWDEIKMIYESDEMFTKMLNKLGGDLHVLARDWENSGSVKGLEKIIGGGLELDEVVDLKASHLLPSKGNWDDAEEYEIDDIKPGSWEVAASNDDPYVYWLPKQDGYFWQSLSEEERQWAQQWERFINRFNDGFSKWLEKRGGVEGVMADESLKEEAKDMLTGLASCVPWHFLANKKWKPDPGFSRVAWEKLSVPAEIKLKN